MEHTGQSDHPQQYDDDMPGDLALRVKALESLLVEKGLGETAAPDTIVETYERKIGPRNGARLLRVPDRSPPAAPFIDGCRSELTNNNGRWIIAPHEADVSALSTNAPVRGKPLPACPSVGGR